MTIAACYVSPEGIVLGADSTSTLSTDDGLHFFNHGQKLFEIGEKSTLGLVTWGMGGLATKSHRSIIAELSDDLAIAPPADVEDIAKRFAARFWAEYVGSAFGSDIQRCAALDKKAAHDPNNAASRTDDEEKEYQRLKEILTVGFCIAGYLSAKRTPEAYQIIFEPILINAPVPTKLDYGPSFWGAPIIILRLLLGYDMRLKDDILASPFWKGTVADLEAILVKVLLSHGPLPIRDAIDFVYTSILSTIKAFKFSNMAQICGGPIELAVITTDRPFRWVKHKPWHSAISEGDGT